MINNGINSTDPVARFQAAQLIAHEFGLTTKTATSDSDELVHRVKRALECLQTFYQQEPEMVQKIDGYLSGRVTPKRALPPLPSEALGLIAGCVDLSNAMPALNQLAALFQRPTDAAIQETFRGREKQQLFQQIQLFLQNPTQPLDLNQPILSRATITDLCFLRPLFEKASSEQLHTIITALLPLTPLVESIDFSNCRALTPATLASLQGFQKLRSLTIYSYPGLNIVTDAHLVAIGTLSHLTSLKLTCGSQVTPAGLSQLSSLSQLQELDFERHPIGYAELELVSNMTQLRSLSLHCYITFTDEMAGLLAKLQELESLALFSCTFPGETLQHVARLQKLTKLTLNGSQIAEESLPYFARMLQLEKFGFESGKILRAGDPSDLRGTDLQHFAGLIQMRKIDLRHTQLESGSLHHFAGMEALEELKLGSTQIGDEDLRSLRALTQLQVLELGSTAVTNEGLPHLVGMKQLRILALDFRPITDKGLQHLAPLTQLQELGLAETKITNTGLAILSQMTELRKLGLLRTKIGDTGLKHIANCTQMEGIVLAETRVTDAGTQHLRRMTRMRWINAYNTQISDATFMHLVDMHQLTSLYLEHTNVTNYALDALQQMKSLTNMNISDSPITKETAARIKTILEEREKDPERVC